MTSFTIYSLITMWVLIQYFSIASEQPDHSKCCCACQALDAQEHFSVPLWTILCTYEQEKKVYKTTKRLSSMLSIY